MQCRLSALLPARCAAPSAASRATARALPTAPAQRAPAPAGRTAASAAACSRRANLRAKPPQPRRCVGGTARATSVVRAATLDGDEVELEIPDAFAAALTAAIARQEAELAVRRRGSCGVCCYALSPPIFYPLFF